MNSGAKEWGATVLRLWAGLLAAYTGYTMLRELGLSSYIELKGASAGAWISVGTRLVLTAGGVAVFAGIAARGAAFFTALAAAYFLWVRIGWEISKLPGHQIEATILVMSVVVILIGPGRLNLGAAPRKSK
jgi:uncharacterized membrane protein YphA (DoxX/SURF4 family)